MPSNRKIKRRALRWQRWMLHYTDRTWRIKRTPGFYRAFDPVDFQWVGTRSWTTRDGLYRHNPHLSRTYIRNMDREGSYRKTSPASGRAYFLAMGLDAAFWAGAAKREPNAYRRGACLEMAEALTGAKTYAELEAEPAEPDVTYIDSNFLGALKAERDA